MILKLSERLRLVCAHEYLFIRNHEKSVVLAETITASFLCSLQSHDIVFLYNYVILHLTKKRVDEKVVLTFIDQASRSNSSEADGNGVKFGAWKLR